MPSPVPARQTPVERPLRRDAQRSREKVLRAAADLFARHGIDVGFDEIAHAAGVGVGTVYRRFPDRDALIDALFSEKLSVAVNVATTALTAPDPWQAVERFVLDSIQMQVQDRGLMQVLANSRLGDQRLDEMRHAMAEHVGALVEQARQAGVIRPDIEPIDLVMIAHLLGGLRLDNDEEIWHRYAALFLDSIHSQHALDLPGPPPTIGQFEQIIHRD